MNKDSNGGRPSVSVFNLVSVVLSVFLWQVGEITDSYVCPFCVSCSLFLFTQTRFKHFYRRRIGGTPSIISCLPLLCSGRPVRDLSIGVKNKQLG